MLKATITLLWCLRHLPCNQNQPTTELVRKLLDTPFLVPGKSTLSPGLLLLLEARIIRRVVLFSSLVKLFFDVLPSTHDYSLAGAYSPRAIPYRLYRESVSLDTLTISSARPLPCAGCTQLTHVVGSRVLWTEVHRTHLRSQVRRNIRSERCPLESPILRYTRRSSICCAVYHHHPPASGSAPSHFRVPTEADSIFHVRRAFGQRTASG